MNIQTTNTKHATYHILPTSHQGFITGCCMVSAGRLHVEHTQRILPGLLAQALGLGTKSKSESEFNEALEARGIILHTSVSTLYNKLLPTLGNPRMAYFSRFPGCQGPKVV